MSKIATLTGRLAAAAAVVAFSVLAIPPAAGEGEARHELRGRRIWGTWYLALDTAPFGLPGGALPALLTVHRDGSLILFDGGDFGGAPVNLVQSPQFGSWEKTGRRSFAATTLFFAGDPTLKDTTLVKRVRFRFRLEGKPESRLVGVVNVEQLACPLPGATPFVTLNCPNPISAPDADWVPEPGTPPDVPFEAWRLPAR